MYFHPTFPGACVCAVPAINPGYPVVSPGSISPFGIGVVVNTTKPVEWQTSASALVQLEVYCDAYIALGDSFSYPQKWETYDDTFNKKFSTTVIGR